MNRYKVQLLKLISLHLSQSSQGRQVQIRACSVYLLPRMVIPGDCCCSLTGTVWIAAEMLEAPSASGIHFINGDISCTFSMYQIFRAGSHLAPRRLASSFSANGTFRFVRISSQYRLHTRTKENIQPLQASVHSAELPLKFRPVRYYHSRLYNPPL